jgi:hypothetical protein
MLSGLSSSLGVKIILEPLQWRCSWSLKSQVISVTWCGLQPKGILMSCLTYTEQTNPMSKIHIRKIDSVNIYHPHIRGQGNKSWIQNLLWTENSHKLGLNDHHIKQQGLLHLIMWLNIRIQDWQNLQTANILGNKW